MNDNSSPRFFVGFTLGPLDTKWRGPMCKGPVCRSKTYWLFLHARVKTARVNARIQEVHILQACNICGTGERIVVKRTSGWNQRLWDAFRAGAFRDPENNAKPDRTRIWPVTETDIKPLTERIPFEN